MEIRHFAGTASASSGTGLLFEADLFGGQAEEELAAIKAIAALNEIKLEGYRTYYRTNSEEGSVAFSPDKP